MRRAARVDRNQGEIVAALRKAGAFVEHLHTVGGGCPDLVAFMGDRCMFLEVKDPAQPPSKQRLTPMEQAWHIAAGAKHVRIVFTPAEALAAIGALA